MDNHQGPPGNPQLERALLGCLIINPGYLVVVRPVIKPDDFAIVRNRWIYEAILDLAESGAVADYVAILDRIEAKGQLREIGGPAYVSECISDCPSSGEAESYAKRVLFYSEKRKLIALASRLAQIGYDDTAPVGDALGLMHDAIGGARTGQGKLLTMKELAHQYWGMVQDWRENKADIRGIPSGLAPLDQITGGFWKPSLAVHMARSGHGKTAFALDMARKAGMAGFRSLFIEAEMQPWALMHRLASAEAGVSKDKIISGRITDQDEEEIYRALGRLSDYGIIVSEEKSPTLAGIYAEIMRVRPDSVFIDHFDLVEGDPRPGENDTKLTKRKMRSLKKMSDDTNTLIYVLAQVNKNIDLRADKHPTRGDLPYGGDEHLDYLIAQMRPVLYDKSADPLAVDIDVLKDREGKAGVGIQVGFNADKAMFLPLAPQSLNRLAGLTND